MDWQLATSGPPMAALLGMLIRARPEQRDQQRSKPLGSRRWRRGRSSRTSSKTVPTWPARSFTLAEIVLGTMVYRWHAFPIERTPLKNLRSWYERMRQRRGSRAISDSDHVVVSGFGQRCHCEERSDEAISRRRLRSQTRTTPRLRIRGLNEIISETASARGGTDLRLDRPFWCRAGAG